jgi:hypothetical protein
MVDTLSWKQAWLPALILLVFTGFLEELIFRGVLQYTALQQLGRAGVIYVSAVYAVLYLGYRSVLNIFFVFSVALIFAWFVWRSGSILGVSLSHGLANVTLYLVFPFLLAHPTGQVIASPGVSTSVKVGVNQIVNFTPIRESIRQVTAISTYSINSIQSPSEMLLFLLPQSAPSSLLSATCSWDLGTFVTPLPSTLLYITLLSDMAILVLPTDLPPPLLITMTFTLPTELPNSS